MQPKKKLQDDKASSEKIRSSSGPEVKTSLDGDTQDGSLADKFLEIMDDFSEELGNLSFGERVCYIYNPLQYAKETHEDFIRKYCQSTKKVLFLGMNPGPFGMAQNGVPFGERDHVVDWLKIEGDVGKPEREHPKRQIQGLECPRKEVSGRRFWDLWKQLCKTPQRFFENGFVYNHCPLVFMSDSGKNITPPTLPVKEREPLNVLCNEMLIKLITLLKVEVVVGIGKFAKERAEKVISAAGLDGVRVELILHPSPANPQANKGWDGIVKKQLKDIDVLKYFVD
ncbi:single-strand selective monofunctional uracil DNA glycosylase-like isoform X2 [Apostichopus japonicus]